jgi:deoxycytidine triphosphate deaminase
MKMNTHPWKKWIPGVLSKDQLKILCKNYITGVNCSNDELFDYSSFDLCLTNEGYKMSKGSVKPSGPDYIKEILDNELAKRKYPNKKGEFKLEKRKTYLFKLKENISGLKKSSIYGQATAKSTIGRVDVLARLIVDGMDRYEGFTPDKIGSGDMYLEITSMTFNVKVKEGISLSQLRLFYSKPEYVKMEGQELYKTLLHKKYNKSVDGSLSVDLSNIKVYNSNKKGCAFYTIDNPPEEPIKLWFREKLNPKDYWKLKKSDKRYRLIIEKEKFYIIRSKERISLLSGVAVYCRATDETIGEMRIHYAGFAHPFFGTDREDRKVGTPLIFEVRGHSIDVNLRDGEKMAILTFYRMSEDCMKPKKDSKKPKIKKTKEEIPYNEQELKLSNIFKEEWK